MNSQLLKISIAACALMIAAASAYSQEAVKAHSISESEASVLRNLPKWDFTTKAYQYSGAESSMATTLPSRASISTSATGAIRGSGDTGHLSR